jgi:hypothetical protein
MQDPRVAISPDRIVDGEIPDAEGTVVCVAGKIGSGQ